MFFKEEHKKAKGKEFVDFAKIIEESPPVDPFIVDEVAIIGFWEAGE